MYTEIKNQETPSQKVIDSYHEELSEVGSDSEIQAKLNFV